MSSNPRLQRLFIIRIIFSVIITGAILSAAALNADAAASIFLEPALDTFGAQPAGTPSEPEATKFNVTPANYDVAANSTGNTFVWTFTAENSAGGNQVDLIVTIPHGFTPPTAHFTRRPERRPRTIRPAPGQPIL